MKFGVVLWMQCVLCTVWCCAVGVLCMCCALQHLSSHVVSVIQNQSSISVSLSLCLSYPSVFHSLSISLLHFVLADTHPDSRAFFSKVRTCLHNNHNRSHEPQHVFPGFFVGATQFVARVGLEEKRGKVN